jgi:hypothetical protein
MKHRHTFYVRALKQMGSGSEMDLTMWLGSLSLLFGHQIGGTCRLLEEAAA